MHPMRRLTVPIVLVAAALVAAEPSGADPTDVRDLVKQLGSDDYAEREAASKRLDAIGPGALTELRAAVRSENPEVARRAHELLRRIERRIDNEKALAATLVTLDAKDQRLDDVLADLSKQAKCEVVLNGTELRALADRRITLSTKRNVPFWDAVLRISDVADLQVTGAGGFAASDARLHPPDALPLPRSSALPRIRSVTDANRAVLLESRGSAPRRPSAIYGAVLVQVLPIPRGASPAPNSALLQIWPEPCLDWRAVSGVKITSALNAAGEKLGAKLPAPAPPAVKSGDRDGVIIMRNRDGSVTFLRGGIAEVNSPIGFKPNTRQAVVCFKPGEKPAAAAKELTVTLMGTVRSGIEPLSRATGLEANRRATGGGIAGVEFEMSYSRDPDGRLSASLTVAYDSASVTAAGVGDELPGVKGGGPGRGNHTVHGVRITDAEGRPYSLGVIGGSSRPNPGGRQMMSLSLELHPDTEGTGPPATATFWGTYAKPVEVPVVLKDVPLSGGK
jgi:hypothetical protein